MPDAGQKSQSLDADLKRSRELSQRSGLEAHRRLPRKRLAAVSQHASEQGEAGGKEESFKKQTLFASSFGPFVIPFKRASFCTAFLFWLLTATSHRVSQASEGFPFEKDAVSGPCQLTGLHKKAATSFVQGGDLKGWH